MKITPHSLSGRWISPKNAPANISPPQNEMRLMPMELGKWYCVYALNNTPPNSPILYVRDSEGLTNFAPVVFAEDFDKSYTTAPVLPSLALTEGKK